MPLPLPVTCCPALLRSTASVGTASYVAPSCRGHTWQNSLHSRACRTLGDLACATSMGTSRTCVRPRYQNRKKNKRSNLQSALRENALFLTGRPSSVRTGLALPSCWEVQRGHVGHGSLRLHVVSCLRKGGASGVLCCVHRLVPVGLRCNRVRRCTTGCPVPAAGTTPYHTLGTACQSAGRAVAWGMPPVERDGPVR